MRDRGEHRRLPARADVLRSSPTSAGFTLVELMVAITGGLIVSLAVFGLARDGSRFYTRETRVAETTLGSVVAFDRISLDLSRAGFMSTPNLRSDPSFCGTSTNIAALPVELRNLASIRVEANTTAAANTVLQTASRNPQSITLSGAYNSVDRYEAWHVDCTTTSSCTVRLQTAIGALRRLGFSSKDSTGQTKLLAQLFPAGRGLRLLNVDTGTFQVATISSTLADSGEAYIILGAPLLTLTGERCGLRGTTLVNVINIVRYRLDTVKGNASYPNYQQLFETGSQPYESNRMELVREELDTSGAVIDATREVVAEYAVDLQFGLTTVNNITSTTPTFSITGFDAPTTVQTIAATTDQSSSRPQAIRAVRARLSLRSPEVDRTANVTTGTSVAPGLYRVQLTDADAGTSGYARVRTLQTDAVVASHMELRW